MHIQFSQSPQHYLVYGFGYFLGVGQGCITGVIVFD